MEDLDEILNGSTPVETPVIEAEAEAPEPVIEGDPGTPRDELGRFAPKGEQDPTAPVETAPPAVERQDHIPPQALQEERRKRQELERELATYRQQQSAPAPAQPQSQPQGSSVPVVFDDEYAQSIFEMAVQHVQQTLTPQIQQVAGNNSLELQRTVMRFQNPDFDQMETAFFEMAQENPALLPEAHRSGDPVNFAYNYAKKALEVRQLGSMDLDAIKAAAIQEYLAKAQPVVPQTIPPPSLADAQSARGTYSTAPGSAPPTLNDILGRR
jgi:hypothetical protein